jgi:hypothetical protein
MYSIEFLLPSLINRVWGNARAFFNYREQYRHIGNFAISLGFCLILAEVN